MACFIYVKKELKLSNTTVSIYCGSHNIDEEMERLTKLSNTLSGEDKRLLDVEIDNIHSAKKHGFNRCNILYIHS